MAEDPKELQGVDGQPGTGGEEVPEPAGETPAEGQPSMPPAVPVEPPTAPPTAERVNLDDLEEFRRWKAESDRRAWEGQQELAQAQQQAEQYRIQAETAEMGEEEKLRYLVDHYQQKGREREQRLAEFQGRIEAQYWLANEAGVSPSEINPMDPEGLYGMVRQVFAAQERQRGAQQPTRRQPAPTPVPTHPPAPSAPTSSAPTSGFDELMSLPYQERRERIRKMGPEAYAAMMEEAGEQK